MMQGLSGNSEVIFIFNGELLELNEATQVNFCELLELITEVGFLYLYYRSFTERTEGNRNFCNASAVSGLFCNLVSIGQRAKVRRRTERSAGETPLMREA